MRALCASIWTHLDLQPTSFYFKSSASTIASNYIHNTNSLTQTGIRQQSSRLSTQEVNILKSTFSGTTSTPVNGTTNMQTASSNTSEPTTVMPQTSSRTFSEVEASTDSAADVQMGGMADGVESDEDDNDALADLEAAGQKYENTGVEEDEVSTDSQAASGPSSEMFVTLSLADTMSRDLFSIYDRAGVEKTVDTATIARFSIEAVVYKWRLLTDAELVHKAVLMEAAKSTLALPYDEHAESREQSDSDKIRLSMRDVIVTTMEGAKWSDSTYTDESPNGRAATNESFESIHQAMSEVADSFYVWVKNYETTRKKAKPSKRREKTVRKTADRLAAAATTSAAAADTSVVAEPTKKSREGDHPVPWGDAEKLKLRKLRASHMWFKWSRAVRTAKLNDWLAENEYAHKRTADAIDQCADGWRKNPATDPFPGGKPLRSKAQWKEVEENEEQESEDTSDESPSIAPIAVQEIGEGQRSNVSEISRE